MREWTNFKDKAPGNRKLCVVSDGEICKLAFYHNGKWIFNEFRGNEIEVKHYIQLSGLPKRGNDR